MLKKGDKVVMHTCLESENPKYAGKIWTCIDDEFKANSSGNGVFLEGFSGYFYTEYLQKINLDEITRVIARNCVAWDTSKDKKEGLLPEVTIANEYLYKQLTGETYNFFSACRKFNIGES